MRYVVDTSVVLKWAIREDDSDAAIDLVGYFLAAPDLIRAELANALWKKVRRRNIGEAQALDALPRLLEPLDLLAVGDHSGRALEIGIELEHPVYDCFFLAVAEALQIPLITADRRLARTCAGTRFAPLVHVLGEELPS